MEVKFKTNNLDGMSDEEMDFLLNALLEEKFIRASRLRPFLLHWNLKEENKRRKETNSMKEKLKKEGRLKNIILNKMLTKGEFEAMKSKNREFEDNLSKAFNNFAKKVGLKINYGVTYQEGLEILHSR